MIKKNIETTESSSFKPEVIIEKVGNEQVLDFSVPVSLSQEDIELVNKATLKYFGPKYTAHIPKYATLHVYLEYKNEVNCITNSPEVQEFIELSSIEVETDNIDTQKLKKAKWQSLTSLQDGETLS